jgi:hypothetical protein
MKKILIGGIVGGVVLFIWSARAWTVLPIHKSSIHSIANEDAVIGALKGNIGAKGVYLFPAMPGSAGDMPTESAPGATELAARKMQQGPVGLIVYDPHGMDPFMASQFIVGLILDLIAAFLAAWLLSRSTAMASPYMARVMFCGVLGIFVSFVSWLPGWNWMGYPMDYTTAMVADSIFGWLIAGLAIAGFVKGPAAQQA